ncbi:unnamed protein product [Arabis nemorensis]|uniref:Uncharacterized protein n=1 Tax=Arabis nemorensis TaxID=586526 RepID=A0A565BDE4_9BRAS|nr:unnamed protein product [Arabis nemorensis]
MASLCSARLLPSPSLDVLGFLSPTKTSSSSSLVCSSSRVHGFSSVRRFSPRLHMAKRAKHHLHVVAMAPEEEKLTRRNPLDFPIAYCLVTLCL